MTTWQPIDTIPRGRSVGLCGETTDGNYYLAIGTLQNNGIIEIDEPNYGQPKFWCSLYNVSPLDWQMMSIPCMEAK